MFRLGPTGVVSEERIRERGSNPVAANKKARHSGRASWVSKVLRTRQSGAARESYFSLPT